MSKGDKRRGNRETKKPKQTKAKVPATANYSKGQPALNIGEPKKK